MSDIDDDSEFCWSVSSSSFFFSFLCDSSDFNLAYQLQLKEQERARRRQRQLQDEAIAEQKDPVVAIMNVTCELLLQCS